MDLSFDPSSWWSYVLVFVAAAVPVVEVLVVIPAAVLAGMNPLPVTVLALAGNLSTVSVVIVAGDRLLTWWRRRRPPREHEPGRAAQRARRMVERWGVPVLAFAAPISTGSHVAAVAALATGATRLRVLGWMIAGLTVWAVAAGVVASTGVDLLD